MIMQPEAQPPAGQQCMCQTVPQRNVHANGRVTLFGPQCHLGRACINTGSQKLAAMQSTAVIEVKRMQYRRKKYGLLLAKSHSQLLIRIS